MKSTQLPEETPSRWKLFVMNGRYLPMILALLFIFYTTKEAIKDYMYPGANAWDSFSFFRWDYYLATGFGLLIAGFVFFMNEQHYRDLKAGRSR